MPCVERTSTFPGVLLDDAVAHRKPQAGAAAGGFRGEEGIEDAVQIFAGNSGTGIGDFDFDRTVVRCRADLDHAARGHGIARIHEEIEENLLQLVIRAQHGRQFLLQISRHLHVRGPERVRDQRKRFLDHGVQIHLGEFRRAGARKIQQIVDDFARAERLLDDFVDQLVARIAAGQLLRQHLNVVGDDGQRRIHFVGDAGGQQAERRELLGLNHLFFQADSLRDVVHQDQPPDAVSGFSDQRRDRNVDHQVPSGAVSHVEFVEAGNAVIAGAGRDFRHQVGRKHFFQLCGRRLRWRGTPISRSSCVFQDSTAPSRSTASTPTLSDSTIFSEKSLSRSICTAFCSSEL